MTFYIQMKSDDHPLETVSECETRREALYEVKEYRMSDHSAHYYVSTRPCRAWKEKGQ